jgi:glucose/sorbosone dehydrogenase
MGIAAVALALIGAGSAQALTLEPVGPGSFDQPIYVTSDPADAGRLFVVEREGTVKLVENGVVSEFTDLSAVVSCCTGERGLLSIALDPDFAANGRLYVDYTGEEEPGEIHVDELTAEPDRDTADPSTLQPLLKIPHSDGPTHNGGQLQFGPDGFLYVSTGDGGGSNDVFENAQDPSSSLGKILRVDPDSPLPYEIWNSGLRNPFRFSFDSLSGDMVIGDVGQAAREEIDFAPSPFPGVVGGAGANYGWNCREGFLPGFGTPEPGCETPPPGGFAEPVFDYPHPAGCASIVGGYVARDPGLGALYGRYLYSDYCAGTLRSLQLPPTAQGLAGDDCSLDLKLTKPVSFGEDAAARLYVVEEGGRVYRLAGAPPPSCPSQAQIPPPPPAKTQPRPTFVGIKPQRRRVERGKVALLTVFVSPCDGRRGKSVELLRNGRRNGSRYLSRACTARFLPRIRKGTIFTAVTRADDEYLAGKSRRLTIRLAHHRRR